MSFLGGIFGGGRSSKSNQPAQRPPKPVSRPNVSENTTDNSGGFFNLNVNNNSTATNSFPNSQEKKSSAGQVGGQSGFGFLSSSTPAEPVTNSEAHQSAPTSEVPNTSTNTWGINTATEPKGRTARADSGVSGFGFMGDGAGASSAGSNQTKPSGLPTSGFSFLGGSESVASGSSAPRENTEAQGTTQPIPQSIPQPIPQIEASRVKKKRSKRPVVGYARNEAVRQLDNAESTRSQTSENLRDTGTPHETESQQSVSTPSNLAFLQEGSTPVGGDHLLNKTELDTSADSETQTQPKISAAPSAGFGGLLSGLSVKTPASGVSTSESFGSGALTGQQVGESTSGHGDHVLNKSMPGTSENPETQTQANISAAPSTGFGGLLSGLSVKAPVSRSSTSDSFGGGVLAGLQVRDSTAHTRTTHDDSNSSDDDEKPPMAPEYPEDEQATAQPKSPSAPSPVVHTTTFASMRSSLNAYSNELQTTWSSLCKARKEHYDTISHGEELANELQSKVRLLRQEQAEAIAREDYERAEAVDEEVETATNRLETVLHEVQTSRKHISALEEQDVKNTQDMVQQVERVVAGLRDSKSTQHELLKERKSDLQKVLEGSRSRLSQQRQQNSMRQGRIERETELVQQETKRIEEAILSETEETQAKLAVEQDAIGKLEEEIADLEALLAAKRSELETHCVSRDDLNARIDVVRSGFEKELTGLRKRNDAIETDREELQADVEGVDTEEAKLEELTKASESEIQNIIEFRMATSKDLRLGKTIVHVLHQVDEHKLQWQQDSQEEQSKIESIKSEVEQNETLLNETMERIATDEGHLREIEGEREKLRDRISQFQEQKQTAVSSRRFKEAKQLKEEISQAETSLESLLERAQQLARSLDEAKVISEEKEEILAQMRNTLQESEQSQSFQKLKMLNTCTRLLEALKELIAESLESSADEDMSMASAFDHLIAIHMESLHHEIATIQKIRGDEANWDEEEPVVVELVEDSDTENEGDADDRANDKNVCTSQSESNTDDDATSVHDENDEKDVEDSRLETASDRPENSQEQEISAAPSGHLDEKSDSAHPDGQEEMFNVKGIRGQIRDIEQQIDEAVEEENFDLADELESSRARLEDKLRLAISFAADSQENHVDETAVNEDQQDTATETTDQQEEQPDSFHEEQKTLGVAQSTKESAENTDEDEQEDTQDKFHEDEEEDVNNNDEQDEDTCHDEDDEQEKDTNHDDEEDEQREDTTHDAEDEQEKDITHDEVDEQKEDITHDVKDEQGESTNHEEEVDEQEESTNHEEEVDEQEETTNHDTDDEADALHEKDEYKDDTNEEEDDDQQNASDAESNGSHQNEDDEQNTNDTEDLSERNQYC